MTDIDDPPWLADTEVLWNWQATTNAGYRNHFWETVTGHPQKRDTFLALRNAPLPVIQKNEVAQRASSYPGFIDSASDVDDIDGRYLSDRKCFRFILQHGGAYEIPYINRPREGLLVRIPSVLSWLANPFHAPVDSTVTRVVEYITTHTDGWDFDPGFKGTNLPLKAYFYARTWEYIDDAPESHSEESQETNSQSVLEIEFDEFGPYVSDDYTGDLRGFNIEGRITGLDQAVSNAFGLKTTLQKLCMNIAAESSDRKNTNTVDFGSPDDCEWTPPSIKTRDSTDDITFGYTLKPRVN